MCNKHTCVSKIIWISSNGYILFEFFIKKNKEIEDFLITISEPVCRTKNIHEFVLTPYALYAAITSGLNVRDILKVMIKLSKNLIPIIVYKMIINYTKFYGKINLILYKCNYFIFIQNLFLLKILLNVIKTNVIFFNLIWYIYDFKKKTNQFRCSILTKSHVIIQINSRKINIENIRKNFIEIDCPLSEEYDFVHDVRVYDIKIDLSPIIYIRNYQEKSVSKIFSKGRARSGIIVLPCGAGKTIIGIAVICIMKKISLIVCNSVVSVEQWKKQLLKWSNIKIQKIKKFITGNFEKFLKNDTSEIIITTYSMISFGGQRAKLSASFLGDIQEKEWGIVVLDEVHVVPANVFRRVLGVLKAHFKIGLTATLLREDRKVGDINFLIGPKLYEASWLDLEKFGYLAMACCAEVCCDMPSNYYKIYLSRSNSTRQIICSLNPTKVKICDFLIRYHENRGDHILVFSDNVFALRSYATKMKKAFIYGATGSLERIKLLKKFQNYKGQTLFISRIGDTSIDLPEANVIIQISSHYGSRRQEAQRLGRILRPKIKSKHAFFYSLVSSGTEEMFYSTKRQQFLVSQGYDFKTINRFTGIENIKNLVFTSEKEKKSLLVQILSTQHIF